MQVLHLLPSVRAHVHQGPVAGLVDADRLGGAHYEAEKGLSLTVLPAVDIVERDDMFSGDNQQMLRGFRTDVAEGYEAIILEDFVAGYLPTRDPTEEAFIHDP